jgi:predicted nucleic acid-binding protein
MQKTRVYIETSVISYLTAKPSREPIKLARQQSSGLLWQMQSQFDFFVSDVVMDEISAGSQDAAQIRLAYTASLPRLREIDAGRDLAKHLIKSRAVPDTSYLDALHIALAAVHGMDYIASWNFKHIVGAVARNRIIQALREYGFNRVTIHTPEELTEGLTP